MEIITQEKLLSTLKNKHLLLDTNVFIDAFKNPASFQEFFVTLKENGITLSTLDVVQIEFLRGSANSEVYNNKKKFIDSIIDVCIPINHSDGTNNLFELTRLLKEDGKSASITDILLGVALMNYKNNLYLMSKNTHDFPTNVFKLISIINVCKRKAVQSYGIYVFEK